MGEPIPLCCPVCKARFRGQIRCSRCGADLSRLMWIVAHATDLRQQARKALRQGRYQEACDLSGQAMQCHATPAGRRLLTVCRIMTTVHTEPL